MIYAPMGQSNLFAVTKRDLCGLVFDTPDIFWFSKPSPNFRHSVLFVWRKSRMEYCQSPFQLKSRPKTACLVFEIKAQPGTDIWNFIIFSSYLKKLRRNFNRGWNYRFSVERPIEKVSDKTEADVRSSSHELPHLILCPSKRMRQISFLLVR